MLKPHPNQAGILDLRAVHAIEGHLECVFPSPTRRNGQGYVQIIDHLHLGELCSGCGALCFQGSLACSFFRRRRRRHGIGALDQHVARRVHGGHCPRCQQQQRQQRQFQPDQEAQPPDPDSLA